MRITNKKLFETAFIVTVLFKAMDGISIVGRIPSYVFYLYSVASFLLYFLLHIRKVKFDIMPFSFFSLLTVYYVLWGTVFIAPDIDRGDVSHEMLRQIIMILFVSGSYLWITEFKSLESILSKSYNVLLYFMLYLFIINIQNINLFRTISSFWEMSDLVRYRTLFSYAYSNIAAELAMAVIVLSLYIYANTMNKSKKLRIIVTDLIMFIIIVANNSRGVLVSAFVMGVVYLFIKANKNVSFKKTIRRAVGYVLIIFIGIMYYLYYKGITIEQLLNIINRQHLLSNVKIIINSGRIWIGLGNISGAYFKGQHTIMGMTTDYMEMFYAGVFVRSGIIGCILIGVCVLLLFYFIFQKGKNNQSFIGKWCILLFSYMLLLSLFEHYLFSNGYASSVLFLTIICSYMFHKNDCYKNEGSLDGL